MSGPTAQTPDSLLTSGGPAQRVEIHQTLILRQLPLRAHVFLRGCVWTHAISQVGSVGGRGRREGVAQTYTLKGGTSRGEGGERRWRGAVAAVESVLIGSHPSSARTES